MCTKRETKMRKKSVNGSQNFCSFLLKRMGQRNRFFENAATPQNKICSRPNQKIISLHSLSLSFARRRLLRFHRLRRRPLSELYRYNIFQFFHFLSRDNHVDEVLKSIAIVVVVDDYDDVYDDGDKNSARIS